MRYVIMIGNGFDIGLGLKTAYSDFIEEYKNSPAIHPEVSDEKLRIEGILKEQIKREPKTWADAEEAFAELRFTEMFGNCADVRRCILDVFSLFTEALKNYLAKQEFSRELNRVSRDVSEAFFLHVMQSVFEGMPEWLREQELNRLGDVNSAQQFPNYCSFINFNYTGTFDKLIGAKIGEVHTTSGHYSFEQRVLTAEILNRNAPFIFERLVHVHGSNRGRNSIFGVSDSRQITDAVACEMAETIGFLVKDCTDREKAAGNYDLTADVLNNADRVILFGMSIGNSDKYWWRLLMERVCKVKDFRVLVFPYSKNPEKLKDDNDYLMLQYEWRSKFIDCLREDFSKSEMAELSHSMSKVTVLSYGPYKNVTNGERMCDPLDLEYFSRQLGIKETSDS